MTDRDSFWLGFATGALVIGIVISLIVYGAKVECEKRNISLSKTCTRQ